MGVRYDEILFFLDFLRYHRLRIVLVSELWQYLWNWLEPARLHRLVCVLVYCIYVN